MAEAVVVAVPRSVSPVAAKVVAAAVAQAAVVRVAVAGVVAGRPTPSGPPARKISAEGGARYIKIYIPLFVVGRITCVA